MKHDNIKGVIIPIPESYKDCFELIRSDFYRVIGKLWIYHFKTPALGFLFYYRLSKYRTLLWPYFRLRMEKYKRKYAFEIPLGANIGYGLYLGHNTSIIVNRSAVIGNNVNLSQFTTIGSIKGTAAIIEDEVYIGPSVCIVEEVRIGNRAMIGAGAVVTKDISPKSSAAGVPTRILKEDVGYTPDKPWPLPTLHV